MRSSIRIFISLTSLMIFGWAEAQDFHFSQFTQTPLFNNPASSGSGSGNIRGNLHYKNQWGWQNGGAVYKTFAASLDGRLFQKKGDNRFLGVGATFLKDEAGDSKIGTLALTASVSGAVLLDDHHTVSAGLSGGFVQGSVANNRLVWKNVVGMVPMRDKKSVREFMSM